MGDDEDENREGVGEREGSRKGGREKELWDNECKKENGKIEKMEEKGRYKENYIKEKKKYAILCERTKKEENEKWTKIAKNAKTAGNVWKVVNRERKQSGGGNNGIELEEWEEYFKRQLGRSKRKWREEKRE